MRMAKYTPDLQRQRNLFLAQFRYPVVYSLDALKYCTVRCPDSNSAVNLVAIASVPSPCTWLGNGIASAAWQNWLPSPSLLPSPKPLHRQASVLQG